MPPGRTTTAMIAIIFNALTSDFSLAVMMITNSAQAFSSRITPVIMFIAPDPGSYP
jgi:hypothetical protein